MTSAPSAASAPYEADFAAATTAYGLPAGLLREVARQESGFDPTSKSSAGAIGIMQFEPDTAAGLGVDPTDPASAIDGAGRYLAQLNAKYNGDWALTLAAYNAGTGNVAKYGGVPPFAETQDYIRIIFGKLGWKSGTSVPAAAAGTTGTDKTSVSSPGSSTTASSSSGATSGWQRVIVEGLFLVGGVGLVVAGIYQTTTGHSATAAVKTKVSEAGAAGAQLAKKAGEAAAVA